MVPLVVPYRQSAIIIKRGSIDWSLSDAIGGQSHMILISRLFSILQIQWTCIIFQVIRHSASIMPILLQMGVVWTPPPAESSADVASPCFDRTGSVQPVLHMQVLWQRQLRKGRSWHSRGDYWQQGGPGMAAIFGPGGPIILLWTVWGDRFRGGTVHGVTAQNSIVAQTVYTTLSCITMHTSAYIHHYTLLFAAFRVCSLQQWDLWFSASGRVLPTYLPTLSTCELQVLHRNVGDNTAK